ncbi:MAG: hypothetical protein HYX84_01070 [Chloroflexi bacterium]|nr:hypothetical protein [Chloroflexota bacterium]
MLDVLCTVGAHGEFLPNMRYYLEQLKHCSGISYRMECDDADLQLEESAEREVSMICIEALTNIKKHAQSQNVAFSVAQRDGHLRISITDDGKGFDGLAGEGHGLSIMRERARLVGGTLSITSNVGKGTEIELDVPRCGGGGGDR